MRRLSGKFGAALTGALALVIATSGVVGAVGLSVIEGSSFSGVIFSFNPVSAGTTAANCNLWTPTITWGDGSPTSTGTITTNGANCDVSGTHTYAEDGGYTISTSVNTPTPVTNTTPITVRESLLSATGQAGSATEGTAFSGVLVAKFADPGSPDPGSAFTATIDWGDGTTSAGTVTATGVGTYDITGSHTYADEGSYTVTTTTAESNELTFSVSVQSTFTVAEADVLSGTGTSFTAGVGVAFTHATGTFTDTYTANVASDFAATIDWGDGSPVSAGTVSGGSGTFTVSGSHSYAAIGTYAVTTTLADDAPGTATATASSTVTVKPPDLAITKSHPGNFHLGQSGTYTIHVANVGPAPRSGSVQVTDLLPVGMPLVSWSASGWACSQNKSVATCTRSDPLAGLSSYPDIHLTVRPNILALGTWTNVAILIAPGDMNGANNTATDPTRTLP